MHCTLQEGAVLENSSTQFLHHLLEGEWDE